MRLTHILRENIARALIHGLLAAYDFDSLTTTRCKWFHNVHVLEVARLSINHPALVVFGEDVRRRCNVKSFPVQSTHPLNVPPHQVFTPDGPRACKVVYMLEGVHVAKTSLSKQACPYYIPSRARDMSEACHLERIYYTVVSVCTFGNFEAGETRRVKLVKLVLYDLRVVFWQVSLTAQEWRGREEYIKLSRRKGTLNQGHYLIWRPTQEYIPSSLFFLFISLTCQILTACLVC